MGAPELQPGFGDPREREIARLKKERAETFLTKLNEERADQRAPWQQPGLNEEAEVTPLRPLSEIDQDIQEAEGRQAVANEKARQQFDAVQERDAFNTPENLEDFDPNA